MNDQNKNNASPPLFVDPQLLSNLVNSLPGIVNIYDLFEQRNIYANRELYVTLGYTPQQIQDMGAAAITTVMHPADSAKVLEIINQLNSAADGDLIEFEFRAKHANGGWRWMWSRNSVHTRSQDGSIKQILSIIEDITERKLAEEALRESELLYHALFEATNDAIYVETLTGRILDCNQAACEMLGYTKSELTTLTVLDLVPESIASQLPALIEEEQTTGGIFIEALNKRKNGEVFPCEVSTRLISIAGQPRVIAYIRDISQRKQAEEELNRYFESSLDLLCIADTDGYFRRLNPEWENTLGYTLAELQGKRFIDLVHPDDIDSTLAAISRLSVQEAVLNFENRYRCKDGTYRWIEWRSIPSGKMIYATARDVTERKLAQERIERQLQHLSALNTIDRAIASSFDLRITLDLLLSHLTTQLRVNAAVVLLFQKSMNTLEFAAQSGFGSSARLHGWQGEALARQAILERKVVNSADYPGSVLIAGESYVSTLAIPLIAKGEVKGVLQIFHRTPIDPDPEWKNFLHILADQTAIAIDNTQLFEGLQRSNTELRLAYTATLEGWSAALDLRDKDAAGHTQSVVDLTLRIARDMDFVDEDLVNVQRGALMHDLGMLGIPDAILQKAGPLSDEEWAIMRKHPEYAYQLLQPIVYMRPAIGIPYCHHEKWDGTGYPRGLKGEEIPLAARIFAVVDVWDALLSDRPYRPAWSVEKALNYIRTQSGAHFDPQVVSVFLKNIPYTP